MKTIKILIPIYNEEESLLFLRNRLTSIINKLTNYRIEVLFINDGSKDNSLKIIEGIRNNNGCRFARSTRTYTRNDTGMGKRI